MYIQDVIFFLTFQQSMIIHFHFSNFYVLTETLTFNKGRVRVIFFLITTVSELMKLE